MKENETNKRIFGRDGKSEELNKKIFGKGDPKKFDLDPMEVFGNEEDLIDKL